MTESIERPAKNTDGSREVVLAGGTGDLGHRIARALVAEGASVRALVRPSAVVPGAASADAVARLRGYGATVVAASFDDEGAMTRACEGAACVVSALSGLHDVIVGAQTQLLEAAVRAGVPRFVPSDFAMDFTRLPEGKNRNFDLRLAFKERLDRAPIRATSILNGAFTDMLTGQAPIVLFPLRRVLYWQNADQPLDFTSMDDTAWFTAKAALDPETPRYLRIAGAEITARELAVVAGEVTGKRFGLLRGGSLQRLERIIRVTRALHPQKGEVFPVWQGMTYLHDMFDGRGKLAPLDNDRYGAHRWTTPRDILVSRTA